MNTKRITILAVFVAAALILSIAENAFPPILVFAPGAKMGLSNVVTLAALILLTPADACVVVLIKCLLSALFGGNISALMYSLPAGLVSLGVEMLLYYLLFPKVSLMGVSFVGAIVHNLTQITVASLITGTNLMLMLPFMLLASVIAGLFVGISVFYLVKYLPKSLFVNRK